MRLWSWNLAAAGALWFASHAIAADNPYGAPAALPAPAARVSPYWTQYASHTYADAPADGRPENVPAVDETVVRGYNGPAPSYSGGPAAGGGCSDGSCGGGLGYGPEGSPYDNALNGCNLSGPCVMPFYASVAGLIMSRSGGNSVYTTYDATNINNQLMHTEDAQTSNWKGGFQITGGYRFGCAYQWGIEATYWMIADQFTGNAVTNGAGNLSTPLDTGFVNFPTTPVTVASSVFDNADQHSISRTSNFLNLELNLLRFSTCCGDNFQCTWLAGVRWFRFEDDLLFTANRNTAVNGINEAALSVNVTNNLVGFQIGTRLAYCITPCFKVFATPTIGVYDNTVNLNANIYNNLGQNAVTNPPAPGVAQNFPVTAQRNNLAFLSSIDLGAEYQVSSHWKLFGGYRVVAAAGVSTTEQQIPHFLNDVPEWQQVKSNGHVILHGAFAGAEFRF